MNKRAWKIPHTALAIAGIMALAVLLAALLHLSPDTWWIVALPALSAGALVLTTAPATQVEESKQTLD